MQCLQDLNQSTLDNLDISGTKKKEYLKAKIYELETNSNIKKYQRRVETSVI